MSHSKPTHTTANNTSPPTTDKTMISAQEIMTNLLHNQKKFVLLMPSTNSKKSPEALGTTPLTQYFEQFVETFHIVPVEPRNKMPYECLGDIAYIGIIAVVNIVIKIHHYPITDSAREAPAFRHGEESAAFLMRIAVSIASVY